MFEAAELGRKVSKDDYKARVPALRGELLEVQNALRAATAPPVVIVFAGVDGAGKGDIVNLLNEWMDPRWIVTRAFGEPSDEELERPEYWRFWRALPPRGRIGLFLSSWYSRPVLDRVYRRLTPEAFEERLNRVVDFEQTLASDGALILKFWMHLGKTAQKKRLKTLENDPLRRWQVDELAWKHWRLYSRFIAAAEHAIRITNRGNAPWMIVEGEDARYRSLAVGEAIRDAVRGHLADTEDARAAADARTTARPGAKRKGAGPVTSILSSLRMDRRVDPKDAESMIETHQGRLNLLERKAAAKGVSTILVFEGWDAAGKGGAIRRVTAALDARDYQVIPIAAPTDEERAHHYLWRFWRHLGRAGRVTIFDRSWYGRVLVERVEGFATEKEWRRAYAEINQFENQLVHHGIVLVKYWLHVTDEEQLRRFKERECTPHKQWKLTGEDWRNREEWGAYELAVNDMIEHTSTRDAPWTLIEANDKSHARIKVLATLCDRLERRLGLKTGRKSRSQ
ncbi:MAG: polyphosphate:AMP phosphotransferase [Acidobacteria bacterium]|nr:polyphosphate:AMP phosphotransferase [Acidobacteriota bacterium]